MSDAVSLLAWYRRHRRELPWRNTADPYRIWLSEIMLQQTRVETVLPYYRAFLERFPVVEDLAAAPRDEVLAAWSGLGYYRRARFLHRAAGEVASHGGFPRTVAGLRELPGVGEYTAAAVASIAFGVAEPVLDGNVERVMTRWRALAGDPKRGALRRELLSAAAQWLDPDAPGDSNQALMELGATICTPRRPKCGECPLQPGCRAAAEGTPESYPSPRPDRPLVHEAWVVAVVSDGGGRVLLFRRSEDAELLAGTWELPAARAGRRTTAELEESYGGRWHLGELAGVVRHGITFRSLELSVRWARVESEGSEVAEGPEAGWFAPHEVAALPHSAMVEKALAVAGLLSGSKHRPRPGCTSR